MLWAVPCLWGNYMSDFFIDPVRRTVEVSNQPVSLQPREFALLLYFMRNQNKVLTPDQICEHAWGLVYTQSVFRSIHDLRKKSSRILGIHAILIRDVRTAM